MPYTQTLQKIKVKSGQYVQMVSNAFIFGAIEVDIDTVEVHYFVTNRDGEYTWTDYQFMIVDMQKDVERIMPGLRNHLKIDDFKYLFWGTR